MARRGPQQHVAQLVGLRADEVVARRRGARSSDPAESRIIPRKGALKGLAEDGLSFQVALRASLVVRLSDDEVWEGRVGLLGEFTSSVALTLDVADAFATANGLYVLWPFARSALDQVSRLAGVDAPQLPLIVRPGHATVRAPRAAERP